jgi:hypothetical protein
MPVTGYEIIGRKITRNGITRQYYLNGPADEEDVLTFIGGLDATLAGFPYNTFNADEEDDIAGDFKISIDWGQPESNQDQKPGESGYKFSFQAPTAHIRRSLATISSYAAPDVFFADDPPDFKGAINVTSYGTPDMAIEGVDLQAPAEVFSIPYRDVDAVIDLTYQALVRSLCGKVNNSAFYGANAGELMLCRADGERSKGVWNLDFGFAYIPNATSIPVGDDITVAAKDGMDLLWTLEMTVNDPAKKMLVSRPVAAYVERVFERADLNDLNLP